MSSRLHFVPLDATLLPIFVLHAKGFFGEEIQGGKRLSSMST